MKTLCAFLLTMAFAVPGFARQYNLGTVKLNQFGDSEVIRVNSCRNNRNDDRRDDRRDRDRRDRRDRDRRDNRWDRNDGELTAIRFYVDREDADIDRLDVQFANGRTQSFFPRQRTFREGSYSRWFDLRGHERCIRAIRVIGDTKTSIGSIFRGKARVTLIGRD